MSSYSQSHTVVSSTMTTQSPVTEQEVEELKKCLPKAPSMGKGELQVVKYQDFWCVEMYLSNILKFQKHFLARDCDFIITGLPKTGTTWLKSLLFATINRTNNPINQSILLKNHPQELVYSLEIDIYSNAFAYPRPENLDELPSPRLLSTHLPYHSLPESIKTSKCKMLYICRNPLDTLVSLYYFASSYMKKYVGDDQYQQFQPPRFEDYYEDFCQGRYLFGPFFEHVIGYWNISLEHPDKVLFLKYEDLKDDPVHYLKMLGDFVGKPFTCQEENEGVIEQIIELCSIGNMKEVNKNGLINNICEKSSYFRKGEVGEWANYFTPKMFEKMIEIMEEKLQGTGLSFKLGNTTSKVA